MGLLCKIEQRIYYLKTCQYGERCLVQRAHNLKQVASNNLGLSCYGTRLWITAKDIA